MKTTSPFDQPRTIQMPRGSGAISAVKCPHFDVSKPIHLENFMNCYKNVKFTSLIEGLKPAAKISLISKLGMKVKLQKITNQFKFSCFDRMKR